MQRVQTPSGLQLLLAANRAAPVVAVQAWIGVGSADEPRRQAGISHFLEHMLFKGSARYGVGEMARAVETAGGEINAWTAFDQTVFHVVLASRHFETAVDVLADALIRPTFDPAEIEREREVILEEIRQTADDPMRTVAQTLFSTAYSRHPYRHPVIGSVDTVEGMRRADLVSFHRRWYVAGNTTLVVTGDVDPDTARAVVEERMGAMHAGEPARRGRHEPVQTAPRVAVETRDVHDAHLAIGFHVPPLTDERAAALDLAAIVLGQGESARMSTRLRRGRELVSSAFAYAHTLRDRGLFVVNASTSADRVGDAVTALTREVAGLCAELPSLSELDKARHAVRADAVYQRETVEGAARRLGYYATMAGDVEFESEILRRVHQLGPREVAAAAAEFLRPENASMAVLLPHRGPLCEQAARDAEADRLEAALCAGFAAVRPAPERRRLPGRDDLMREVLPSGVRLVVKRDASVPLVALRAIWPGGARYESPRSAGITNLLAACITAGAGDRSAEAMIDQVDDLAGTLVGISGRNSFGVRSEWLAPDWERGFDLMADCLLAPRFEETAIERERRQIIDDLASRRESAGFVVFRNFAETLFQRHPYRLPVAGTPDSVAGLNRRRVRDFYRRNYPPGQMTLAVVGDVDPDRLIARAAERLPAGEGATASSRRVPREQFTGRAAELRQVVAHMAREQAHLVVGFPGLTIADPDRPALELLMTVLGGQGGRLFARLRDQMALAYRVSAFSVEGLDPGYVAAYIACAPDKLTAAIDGIRGELDRIAAGGVSRAELERGARYLIGVHEISLQRRAGLAATIAINEAYGVGHDYHLRYARDIERVTADQVVAVAARLFDWRLAVTSIVSPEGADH